MKNEVLALMQRSGRPPKLKWHLYKLILDYTLNLLKTNFIQTSILVELFDDSKGKTWACD